MGLSASQTRLLSLYSRKNDLEFQGQQINNKRTVMANLTQSTFSEYLALEVPVPPIQGDGTTEQYTTALAQYNAEKATYDAKIAAINAKSDALQAQDRSLEMELKNVDTQHAAVQTEIDAVKKVIDKNIEATFKTFQ